MIRCDVIEVFGQGRPMRPGAAEPLGAEPTTRDQVVVVIFVDKEIAGGVRHVLEATVTDRFELRLTFQQDELGRPITHHYGGWIAVGSVRRNSPDRGREVTVRGQVVEVPGQAPRIRPRSGELPALEPVGAVQQEPFPVPEAEEIPIGVDDELESGLFDGRQQRLPVRLQQHRRGRGIEDGGRLGL